MARQDEIVKERLKKIEELRKKGIKVYEYSYTRDHFSYDIKQKYENLKNNEKAEQKVSVAGRVLVKRQLGKISFCHILDDKGKLQVVFEEKTSKQALDFFNRYVDTGDFIGVKGFPYKTKRGEISVLAKQVTLLSKAILPLPEKWHGLVDKESRYRQRYLDLIMNPEVKEVFIKRSNIVNAIREFLNSKEFIEVQTPILQAIYGGAAARPFKTFINELKQEMFLRTSDELYLKRLIIGNFERVYEIGKDFRNEAIDSRHNPEFTQIEIYKSYADYNDIMKLFIDIVSYAAKKINGTTKISYQGKTFDLSKWKKMTMIEAIKRYAGVDVKNKNVQELKNILKENNVEVPKLLTKGTLINAIFESIDKNIIEPTIIMDHPKETTPLCKKHRKDTEMVERFEPFCCGMELGNAYSELNDPILQRHRLEEQVKLRKNSDEPWTEALDTDFIKAMEYGMPPTGGLGIGIDRLTMILTGQESIRDVILFPFMKIEKNEVQKEQKDKKEPEEDKFKKKDKKEDNK